LRVFAPPVTQKSRFSGARGTLVSNHWFAGCLQSKNRLRGDFLGFKREAQQIAGSSKNVDNLCIIME
jgi:hypothetical protein